MKIIPVLKPFFIFIALSFVITVLYSCKGEPSGSSDTGINTRPLTTSYIPDAVTPAEETYIILSDLTGNAFHFSDGAFEGGHRVIEYTRINSRPQKFTLIKAEDRDGIPLYHLKSNYMNKELSVNAEGTHLVCSYNKDISPEAFAIEKNEKGEYRFLLSSKNYEYALCVDPDDNDIGITVKKAEDTEDEYFSFIMESEAEKVATFTNPLSSGHAADPFVTYHDGYYYTLTTWGNKIRLYRSKTLNTALTSEFKDVFLQGNEVGGLIWAPELHYYPVTDRWYIYSSGSTKGQEFSKIRMFCLESETNDPYSDYTFKGFTDKNTLAIDQTVFYDEKTETLYTAFSQFASEGQIITLAVMDDPWTISKTKRIRASYPLYSWETMGAGAGKDQRVNEGPIFLENNGKLFLIYSASGCWSQWYCLGMLEFTKDSFTEDNMLDLKNWKKSSKPVFSAANTVYGVGHCAFFKSPDGTETWMSFHGMPTPTSGEAGRYMYAQKITFDEDSRPVLGVPLPRNVGIPVPSGEQ
ncbi:MAG: hypothetical protein E7665_07385 [Ruminococcaceae bacterium]|nr:hypothetical protein [Oscillospiraceae bacterium]